MPKPTPWRQLLLIFIGLFFILGPFIFQHEFITENDHFMMGIGALYVIINVVSIWRRRSEMAK